MLGSCRTHEFRQADEIVGCSGHREGPSNPFEPSIFCLFETGDGVHPAKAFFDALANALADGIARMPGCPPIAGGSAAPVLCDMRRDVDVAQLHDEVGGIEASVATERDRFGSIGAWLDHLERRQPFG